MTNIKLKYVCPETGKPLSVAGNKLISEAGREYNIINNIPVLLPKSESSGMNYIEHYKKDAEVYDYFEQRDFMVTREEEKRLHEYIFSQIPNNSKIVLDVGSGGGWLAKKAIKKGKEIYSMDISYKNVKKALEKYNDANHFGLVADALHLPIADCQFDCIVASEIIEHVVDPELFIQHLFRALKSGGRLIVSTPYKEKIKYILCTHCNKLTPFSAHLHSFDENTLFKLNKSEKLDNCFYKTFSNKIMNKSRLILLFKFFPFFIWKNFDAFFNNLYSNSVRIIVVFNKSLH